VSPLNPVNVVLNTDGTLTLSFQGMSGVNYALEAASNLVPPINWQVVATQAAGSNGLWQFTDTGTSNFPARFYRSTLP
jgi:hypothetical protein